MNNLETKTLKLLLNKDAYNTYGESISNKIFNSEVKGLLKTISYLHKKKQDDNDLTTDEVYHLYEQSETTTVARLELIKELLRQVAEAEPLSADVTLEVISKLHEKEAARKVADKALAIVQRSEGAMTLSELKDYVAEIDAEQEAEEIEECATDIETIKEAKKIKGVFKWGNGLEQLSEDIPSLSRGHFMIVFASTNAGKSSFVAQAAVGYLQQGHKVLYLGNEDPAEDIVLNLIRSVEDKTEQEVMTGATLQWNKIRENFTMISAHGMGIEKIESLIVKYKPDVVIYDQLDNVPVSGKQDKRHEALENLYQKTRQWGAKYDILNIAVSQANDEATGKLHLRSNMMANSRIGKGGTADVILGIGMKSVDNQQRSICICKNKITGRHEVIHMVLDSERCRYEK